MLESDAYNYVSRNGASIESLSRGSDCFVLVVSTWHVLRKGGAGMPARFTGQSFGGGTVSF